VAAAFLAIRAGLKEVRMGHAAYEWAILSDPVRRHYLLRGLEGDRQSFLRRRHHRPDLRNHLLSSLRGAIDDLAVAVALVPYVLIRGPINRVVQRWQVAVSLSISRIYAEGISPDDL
jgi:hypothetical protein